MNSKAGDVLIIEPIMLVNKSKQVSSVDYLDEYDEYYLDNEKYLVGGHGGKQRTKKECEINSNKYDPCGNVRLITSKLQNFEHNRRKLWENDPLHPKTEYLNSKNDALLLLLSFNLNIRFFHLILIRIDF